MSQPQPGRVETAPVRRTDVRDACGDDPSDIDLVSILVILGRYKRLLAAVPVAAALVAAVIAFQLPPTYTATARILPPQQPQSATMMLGQLPGGLAGIAGSALGIRNPNDLYIDMLKSATVADRIIERFGLRKEYRSRYQAEARAALARVSKFGSEKSGVINIVVDAREPALAAQIANAYVDELYKLTNTLAISDAAQRRVFFERQLELAKDKLATAEAKLRSAIDAGGIVSVDAQSRSAVETTSRLRAQITAKQIELDAMRSYATRDNPEVLRAEQQLASIRRELAQLESGSPSDRGRADSPRGVATIPFVREVKYQEAIFELLAKQLELARADEAKEAPMVQMLDRATPPEYRSKPQRSIIVLAAFAIGLVLSIIFAFTSNALRAARLDPDRKARIDQLKVAWRRTPPNT